MPQALGGGAFLVAMLQPFLRHISKESRRCAELLVQLPPDFDVEGMIAATWSAVKHVGALLSSGSVLGQIVTAKCLLHHPVET
jgi:hypothetical protein